MTEIERYKLCRHLPRLACGTHFHIARDIVQAYLDDAQWLLSMSEELQQEYELVQKRYGNLSPDAKAIAERLLPWILQVRLRYGDLCADTILACYPQTSVRAKLNGLLGQPN